MTKIVKYAFRWPVKPIGEKEIEVLIPTGANGTPVLNPEFVKAQKLSGKEVDEAEYSVLESIAIIR